MVRTTEINSFENTIAELGDTPFQDGGHIIYVNGEFRDLATPVGRLMHDSLNIV